MQRLKILGVALMAVFALSAVVSATASAALPVVLPETAETWKGTSGSGTLETLKGTQIVCKEATSEGTIEAKKPLGLFHIDLHGCSSSGVECMSLGDKNETILVLGSYHIVFDSLKPLGTAILFLLEPVHNECPLGGSLLILEGEVLCLIKPIEVLTKHLEIVCDDTKGDPSETVYWGEKGEEIKIKEGLKTIKNEKTTEASGESTTSLILTTNEILIMA